MQIIKSMQANFFFLPFFFCFIQDPCKSKGSFPPFLWLLFVFVHGSLVDHAHLIQQVPHQCTLTSIHMTCEIYWYYLILLIWFNTTTVTGYFSLWFFLPLWTVLLCLYFAHTQLEIDPLFNEHSYFNIVLNSSSLEFASWQCWWKNHTLFCVWSKAWFSTDNLPSNVDISTYQWQPSSEDLCLFFFFHILPLVWLCLVLL